MPARDRRPASDYRTRRLHAGRHFNLGADGRVTGPAGAWDRTEAALLADAAALHRILMGPAWRSRTRRKSPRRRRRG